MIHSSLTELSCNAGCDKPSTRTSDGTGPGALNATEVWCTARRRPTYGVPLVLRPDGTSPLGHPTRWGGLTAGQRDLALRNRVRGASAGERNFPLGPPAAQRVPKVNTHAVSNLETC